MSDAKQPAWLWLDLEMTGLDATRDRLLEAAVIVTDPAFNELSVFETPVFQPPEVLETMNDWCKTHHGASGLTQRVPDGIREAELDEALCRLVEATWGTVPAVLCGNSIHQDRKFVDRWLPRFAAKLHYRMLDVSSFKVLFSERFDRRFDKRGTHRALDDIRESIAELRYYLDFVHVD